MVCVRRSSSLIEGVMGNSDSIGDLPNYSIVHRLSSQMQEHSDFSAAVQSPDVRAVLLRYTPKVKRLEDALYEAMLDRELAKIENRRLKQSLEDLTEQLNKGQKELFDE